MYKTLKTEQADKINEHTGGMHNLCKDDHGMVFMQVDGSGCFTHTFVFIKEIDITCL